MEERKKKKVLLHWWYDRKDLTAPFLLMQDVFDFTVLFYKYPQQETSDLSTFPFRRIYWSDYNSPHQILNDIQPDLVIFFGVRNKYTVGLLLASKGQSIPTCYLTHGLHGSLKDTLQKQEDKLEESTPVQYKKNNQFFQSEKWRSSVFFLRGISLRYLSALPFAIGFMADTFKKGPQELKLSRRQSPHRLPDYQIFFAPAYTRRFVERDNLDLKTVLYSGPYTMDAQFKDIFSGVSEDGMGNEVLFIDQPMITLSTAQMADFYLRVAKALEEKGKKLIIKLHPLNYQANWLPAHDNIQYERDEKPITQLIQKAQACMGFYSALLLPVICKRKCILFNPSRNSIVEAWEAAGVVKIADFHSFDAKDLSLDAFDITQEARAHFIREFIHDTSGQCAANLKAILLSIAEGGKES